jgi:maltose alpha-D-glucosyltransferase/alpha-amylase
MRDEVMSRLRRLLGQPIDASRIRIHGDFHAGQVLGTGRDFVIIDFEGEPGRPLSERRHKRTALIDVAGMLRSFHYAAYGTLLSDRVGDAIRPEDVTRLEPWARFWYRWAAATYLRGYLTEARHEVFVPRSDAALAGLLEAAMINKVLYELNYELNNRPDWLAVPLRGLFELLGQADEEPIDAA